MLSKNYIIEFDQVLPGDILLTADRTLSSKGIRAVTWSDYSHAMICVAHGSCIHALPDGGVQAVNLQRMLFVRPEHVRVLRLKAASASIQKACDFARSQVGKQYSLHDAARSVTKRARKTNRQFCSRLVAECYDFAGISLVPDPLRCTPKDLGESLLLTEVDVTVRRVTTAELAFANSPDPIARQTAITRDMFANIRKVIGADIQTDEQLLEFLVQDSRKDAEVAAIVRASGYLDMWKHDVAKNKWRYDLDHLAAIGLPADKLEALCHREISGADEQLRVFRHMFDVAAAVHSARSFEYSEQMAKLYYNLVYITERRLDTFRRALVGLRT